MKEFKLKKSYPGSPIVGSVYTQVSHNRRQYLPKNRKSLDIIMDLDEYPEIWEEVIKKDYEILRFVNITTSPRFILRKCENGLYTDRRYSSRGTLTEDYMLTQNHLKIHSVKRLSDGEVFTVGDNLKVWDGVFKLEEIFILENEIRFFMDFQVSKNQSKGSAYQLSSIELEKPLFTTEDGVDIYEGYSYYAYQTGKEKTHLGKNCNIGKIQKVTIRNFPNAVSDIFNGISKVNLNEPTVKRFSTREAAEKWILENTPCISLNDILSLLQITKEDFESLKQLAKSKL